MYRTLVLVTLISFLVSCNDDQPADPLKAPPYDKITDSIRNDPKSAELYFHRGSLLKANDQPVFAERDIRKAWELSPKEEYAYSLVTLYRLKSVDTAMAFIEEALKKLPANIPLRIGLARGLQEKGKLEEAEAVCTKIIQDFPGQLDALTLKAELMKQQGRDNDAIAVLEQAYVFAPGDVDLVHQLAFSYADSKNPKVLALADSLIAVDVEKRHPEPFYFKGLYHENKGNYVEAIKFFNEAIGRDYYFIDAYMDKGQSYYNMKKYPDAIKTFSLATTVSPTYADAYYWLAKTEEATGQKEEAKLDYQRAYGLDKTMKEAKEAADRL